VVTGSFRIDGAVSLAILLDIVAVVSQKMWTRARTSSATVSVQLPDDPEIYDDLALGGFQLRPPPKLKIGPALSLGALQARAEISHEDDLGRRLRLIAELDIGLDPFQVQVRQTGTDGRSEIELDPRIAVITISSPDSIPDARRNDLREALARAAASHNVKAVSLD
jgi:hypothetical protein